MATALTQAGQQQQQQHHQLKECQQHQLQDKLNLWNRQQQELQ